MRLTESVSFWIIIFSLIVACLIGSATHWIVGFILFFIIAGKSAIYGLVIDTISGGLKYHHDREEERARKTIASLMVLKAAKSGVRPVTNMRLTKL